MATETPGANPERALESRGLTMRPQLRSRSEVKWTGVRVDGFHTVHSLEIEMLPGNFRALRPKCRISTGSTTFKPTNDEVTCARCARILAKPKLTPGQKAYLQGWRHGTKDELKKGPANQKDEALRTAYLQGFEHGLSDLENAEFHGTQTYGSST